MVVTWRIVAILRSVHCANTFFFFFFFFFFFYFIVPHSYMPPVRGLAPGGLCLNITLYYIVIQGRIGYVCVREREREREEKKKKKEENSKG